MQGVRKIVSPVKRNRYFIALAFCFSSLLSFSKTNPVLDFAKQQITQKYYTAAISTLNSYLETHPKDVEGLYWKAFCYWKTENYTASVQNYLEVTKLDAKYLPAYQDLGAMYMKQRDYKTAVTYFNTALALKDTDINLLNTRGMCYYYIDKYDLAMKDFNKVLKLDPENYLAYNNRGSATYNNQDIATANVIDLRLAEKDFNMSLKLKPDFELAYRNRGIVRYYMDSLTYAYKDLFYAIQLDPGDDNAHYFLGKLFFKQSNYPVAMQFYDNAIKIADYKWEMYLDRGICKMEMGNYSGARADYYKAMSLSTDHRQMEWQTARSFGAEGNKNDAMYALREAKKVGLFIDLKYFTYLAKDKYFVNWNKDKAWQEFVKELKFGKD